ncbi:A-kinase anchor protein 12b isoform X2 [Heterodontus francisci]|uniref:A-kinase anchor protein 12b isoform X2 n=1 Tax=Heterodontus francisci TaxID=7792 RepID=UPI00355AF1C1
MGAGTSAQDPARLSPADNPSEDDKSRQESVQKNGQISGIHAKSEDQEALDGKSEQLNGLQEEVIPGEVGQGEPSSISQKEELEEMELEQRETLIETKDEQKDVLADLGPPAEIGEQVEEMQAGEIGFKKVFKFVGFKFTVKKEKSVKSEPVQLLTVTKEEGGEATAVDGESRQETEGRKNGELSPVIDEALGSPPEILSPGKVEECTDQAEMKPAAAEDPLVQAESAVSPVESPAVDSALKRFFRQGFFSGLRRKPSFKKAKDEPLVIDEKTEVNGEKENGKQVRASEDAEGEQLDHGAKAQPSTIKEASTSQEASEILDVQTVEEKKEGDDDFEDLTAELASVTEAKEVLTMDEGKKTEIGVPAEEDKLCEPALKLAPAELQMDQVNQLSMRVEQSTADEGQVRPESAPIEAPAGTQAEQTVIAQGQSSVKASELVLGEAELLSSQEKAKLQGSPLKKLFTSSSIKKLSGKKTKAKKGETKLGDAADDDVRMQSSTESEESPESQKPETPLTSPEEMGETMPTEMVETLDRAPLEVEEVNGVAERERRKENITAWASFKKLVTPKKRPKRLSESDKEDEQTDKAKSATISSNESAASVEKQEEPKSNAEEQNLERSIEDPKKKVDAPVSWEALICVGSSKKRARKLSDSEAPEESGQAQEHAEELKADSPQDPDQEQGGASPECVASPVEGEASDGAVSTWESFKRLVTSRRKSKSKLEECADESVTSTEAVLPETEPAKEESWVSFKKLIGRRKKRSDAKPEQLQAECVGKETKWLEFGANKSEEESDTPAVVPLSEYDAVEEERVSKEQQVTVGTDAIHMDGVLAKPEAPPEVGELSAEQTCTMKRGVLEAIKSVVDERSPSWISAAVSNVIEMGVEDEKIETAEEALATDELVKKQMVLGDATPKAEVTSEAYPSEIAEEAQEIISEVVTAPEYPAEESLTEETTEMVSAVSQLTETPVTTAEGTPIREDEALVTRQTQQVLQEAAEKVKLSAGPIVSFCEMAAAPEIQDSEREPEISTKKIQHEVLKVSCKVEMPESAQKGKASKLDTAPKASDVAEGTIQKPPVENEDVQHELGEMLEQTTTEMQEVSVPQRVKTETIPQTESAASACLATTAEAVQEVGADATHAGEHGTPREDEIEGPVGMMRKTDVGIVAEEIVKAEIGRKVEIGMSEAMVAKVGTVREETLEVSEAKDVEKQEATYEEPIEATRASCMKEVERESRETMEVAEKMGLEHVAECRETTEETPSKVVEKIETIFERTGEAIPEVAHQVGVGNAEAVFEEKIENVQEIGEKVGTEKSVAVCRETLASVKKVEVVREQSTEIIPVNVSEAVCNQEMVRITPEVAVTEVCSEETINISPDVEVTEVVQSEETVQITPVLEVTEALPSEKTIKITPVVEVTAVVCTEETIDTSPVVEVAEAVRGEMPIDASPVVEVAEAVHGKETVDASLVAEAVCGEETVDASLVMEAGVEDMQRIDEDAQKMATDKDKIVQEQFSAVKIRQQIGEAKEHVKSDTENMGTEMSEAMCDQIAETPERIDEQRTKGQVVETLISATENIQQEPSIEGLSKETIQTSIMECVIIGVKSHGETEIVAISNDRLEVTQLEGAKEETRVELGQETDVVEIQKTETEVNQHTTKEKVDPTVAMLSKDQCEISPGEQVEKTKTAETEVVESATKQFEIEITCVANELQSTATEALKGTHEGTSLEPATEVVELVEKVGSEQATVEKDRPAPDEEVELIKVSHKAGELVQDDQLDGTDKDGQDDVTVNNRCKAIERADAQKGDDVELAHGATGKCLINLESPGELASTKTLVEECKEESKLEVVPESECLTLESDHEIKLHSGSIDEFQVVQSETVTPIVDLSVAECSESHEVVFLVTAAAVEEQVIAETAESAVTELPESSAVDQVLQPAESDDVQGPVVETAAAIVEVAIEAAAGCLSDVPGLVHEIGSTIVLKQQSSSTEQLEGGLIDHKIEGIEQKLESLEMENQVKVGLTRTSEQQSVMVAPGLIQDVVMLTEGQVDIPSQQEKDYQIHKDEEKVPGPQKLLATEGRGDEAISQRVQTQGSKDTEAIERELVAQPTEILFEATAEGDQKQVENEAVASVETERERESLSDHISEESAILPDGSKVTEAECCQSLAKPEGTYPSLELTERKDQLAETQPLAEKQTSIQGVQARMISSAEENLTQGLVYKKVEGDAMEPINPKDDKETDQNQTIEAVEKRESQEMETGHQMDRSSTLECAKGAAEKTPS